MKLVVLLVPDSTTLGEVVRGVGLPVRAVEAPPLTEAEVALPFFEVAPRYFEPMWAQLQHMTRRAEGKL